MKYTPNLNLKKPEYHEVVNIDDLNENADIIDQKLKELEDGVYNAPPNSVNDLAIGTRTPDQTQVPTSPGGGTLSQILSWLANRIKTITGKTNWWEDPPTTLQAAKDHIDAAAPHSGHETPSGAQAKADAALSSAKAYTDQEIAEVSQALNEHKAAAAPHSGHETPAGAQAKADAALASAKDYTDQQISAITPEQIGAETPAGAQAKAAAAEANAKNYADETKVSKAGDTITGILTMDGGNAINFGGKFQIAYNSATNSLDITVVG